MFNRFILLKDSVSSEAFKKISANSSTLPTTLSTNLSNSNLSVKVAEGKTPTDGWPEFTLTFNTVANRELPGCIRYSYRRLGDKGYFGIAGGFGIGEGHNYGGASNALQAALFNLGTKEAKEQPQVVLREDVIQLAQHEEKLRGILCNGKEYVLLNYQSLEVSTELKEYEENFLEKAILNPDPTFIRIHTQKMLHGITFLNNLHELKEEREELNAKIKGLSYKDPNYDAIASALDDNEDKQHLEINLYKLKNASLFIEDNMVKEKIESLIEDVEYYKSSLSKDEREPLTNAIGEIVSFISPKKVNGNLSKDNIQDFVEELNANASNLSKLSTPISRKLSQALQKIANAFKKLVGLPIKEVKTFEERITNIGDIFSSQKPDKKKDSSIEMSSLRESKKKP